MILGKVCMGGMVRYLAEPVQNYKPRLSKPFTVISNPEIGRHNEI